MRPMKHQHVLIERAQTQEGLMARFQLADLDLTRSAWWRARQSARWDELSPNVLRLVGSPETDTQRALAAVLDVSPGGMLHGDAGFTVAVIWEDDLWKHPRDVAKTVTDVRQQARAGKHVVIHTPSCPWPSSKLAA